ncbi:MAG: 5-formyltetrahydrofolate cyclo-ligase [Pseudonocardiales bacterium]|jgi:5-formyltetrahydrofolate cyclo-ligase|nr:5-formyltetrahydrofolate cyclo-ligase [Pseudonocardiales bacterium]
MHQADDVTAEKARLRAELSAVRAERSPERLDEARGAIRSVVLAQSESAGWRCVAAYVALRTEPGSAELLAELASRGIRVLVPVTLADRDLDWAEWLPDGTGEPLGLEAIASADVVLVPALAVAADGTRLGRGGGSYDRALARAAPDAPRVALLFDGEQVPTLPRESWDLPVTDVVSPTGWRRL